MDIKLYSASAMLNDEKALKRLVAPLPNGQLLKQKLRRLVGRTQAYDEKARKGFFVVCDGKQVECYTVEGITLEQSAQIQAMCDGITEYSFATFKAQAVEPVLGPIEFVQ